MDSLMISTITKMDVGEGDMVIDKISKLSVDLDIEGSDAGELYGKLAMYIAVSDRLGRIPEPDPESAKALKLNTLYTRLADYFGCTEADILAQLETQDVRI